MIDSKIKEYIETEVKKLLDRIETLELEVKELNEFHTTRLEALDRRLDEIDNEIDVLTHSINPDEL